MAALVSFFSDLVSDIRVENKRDVGGIYRGLRRIYYQICSRSKEKIATLEKFWFIRRENGYLKEIKPKCYLELRSNIFLYFVYLYFWYFVFIYIFLFYIFILFIYLFLFCFNLQGRSQKDLQETLGKRVERFGHMYTGSQRPSSKISCDSDSMV